MAVHRQNQVICEVGDIYNAPIVSSRAPTTRDRAEIGTIWCQRDVSGTDNVFILTSIVANISYWTSCGGGTGTFDAVTVNPGDITATAGDLVLTAGDISMPLGSATFGTFGAGVVFSSAVGLLSSVNGTNGQVIIAGTGGNPAWAELTAGAGIAITPLANAITITATGATASSFDGDGGGTAVPDGTGATAMAGGTNITSVAAVNTVTFNLDDSITLAGAVTAGVDLTMSTGVCTITGTTDAPQTIYLRANGGVTETIDIHSDQGTAVNSVNIHSDLGGLTLVSDALASTDAINITATLGGIDMDSALQTSIVSSENSATAIYIHASAGGIGIRADGGALEPLALEASSAITLTSTYNAANSIYLHANGGATESIYIHADQGTAVDSINIDSDAGGVSIIAGLATNDAINITATAGGIDVDALTQINIVSAQAAATAIVVDASDVAGGIDVDYGTGGMTIDGADGAFTLQTGTGDILLGADAVEHNITIGNITGDTVINLNSGTGGIALASTGAGDITINSDDTLLLDADGVLELNSSAGIIGIGSDADAFNINIGTGAAERIVTIGNITTATQVVVDCGTAGVSIGASATAHTSTFGSTDTTSITTIQAGTGALTLTAGGIFDVNATDAISIDSSAGAIGIGGDDIDQPINIGIVGERVITVGNIVGVTGIALNSGTAGIAMASTGTGDITLNSGDTLLLDAAGAVEINSSAGVIDIGNDVINQAIRIGAGGERTVTIGGVTTASSVVVQVGTGPAYFGANATEHLTIVGSITSASATTIQAGTGDFTITAGGILDVNATGNVTIDSSAGTINIGVDDIDQAINIGTVGERVITVGNIVGVTGIVLNSGTAGIALASTGAGDITLNSGDTILIDAVGVLELNSSGGIISIGNDADALGINIGTGASNRDIAIGNTTAGTEVVLIGGDNGDILLTPAADSAAGTAITLNAKVGVVTLTGNTTATTAQETFTITNSEISATSGVMVTVSNVGTGDARMTLEQVKPAAGSMEIMTQNNGADSLNGNVIISWIVLS